MSSGHKEFQARVQSIRENHRAFSRNGREATMRPDGLIVIRPRRITPRFPWRGLMLIGVTLLVFKSVMLGYLGQAEYSSRLAELQNGNPFEQFGGWFMSADVVTQFLAETGQSFMRRAAL